MPTPTSTAAATEGLVRWLDGGSDAPTVMPSPFDDVGPHPLARAAALALQDRLTHPGPELAPHLARLFEPGAGKMFGVLLVRAADGRVGVLQAFSGQLGGQWLLPGFVPPLFDAEARARLEPEADAIIKALGARLTSFAGSAELAAARAAVRAFDTAALARRRALKATHQARRAARHLARAAAEPPALRELDELSRADDRARRALEATLREERAARAAPLAALERRLAALTRLRRLVSQEAMRRLHDTYVLRNGRGEQATVRSRFAPAEPPWGAGDCAAPKLVAWALGHGLQPVALAEFWWGAAPPGGGRVHGAFFPACREKCGPLLPFQLEGLPVAPRARYQPRLVGADELVVVHEDARVLVLDKPVGLLSVPGLNEAVTDSVLERVRRRHPSATGPLLVHRLDLDTSGLVLVALDAEAHRLLQAQFIARTVRKRYLAVLEGEVAGESGTVSLPLRVDLEQRPRQLVDLEHGRRAVTRWRVLERTGGRTRVELVPHTGRTHQLRVHCAHPDGLGAPIVGDRLYGQPGERLLLHARALGFVHPDGEALTFESAPPF